MAAHQRYGSKTQVQPPDSASSRLPTISLWQWMVYHAGETETKRSKNIPYQPRSYKQETSKTSTPRTEWLNLWQPRKGWNIFKHTGGPMYVSPRNRYHKHRNPTYSFKTCPAPSAHSPTILSKWSLGQNQETPEEEGARPGQNLEPGPSSLIKIFNSSPH